MKKQPRAYYGVNIYLLLGWVWGRQGVETQRGKGCGCFCDGVEGVFMEKWRQELDVGVDAWRELAHAG